MEGTQKMIFDWETEDERLLRLMKISAYEKMRWLKQFNEFIYNASDKKTAAIRKKLRKKRE